MRFNKILQIMHFQKTVASCFNSTFILISIMNRFKLRLYVYVYIRIVLKDRIDKLVNI